MRYSEFGVVDLKVSLPRMSKLVGTIEDLNSGHVESDGNLLKLAMALSAIQNDDREDPRIPLHLGSRCASSTLKSLTASRQ
jgi:hypothetical protein